MKKKKLFIEDLERRRSTSPLLVSTQAVGENGTAPKDKMPEYGGERGFKKPAVTREVGKYAPPPVVIMETGKYAPPPPAIEKYAPPNPPIDVDKYAGPWPVIEKYAPPNPPIDVDKYAPPRPPIDVDKYAPPQPTPFIGKYAPPPIHKYAPPLPPYLPIIAIPVVAPRPPQNRAVEIIKKLIEKFPVGSTTRKILEKVLQKLQGPRWGYI